MVPAPEFDFGSGRADPQTFPTVALQEAAVRAIARCGADLTNYPGPLGYLPLRQAMARRETEREGRSVDADHLLLCNGSMQAVILAAQTLQQAPGDTVLVEAFSYPGSLTAFRNLGLQIRGVPLGDRGLRLDALADALRDLDRRGRQARFIYVTCTYQNPTGYVMPAAERRELIDLAARFGVPVVEDNCYADIHFEGPVEPALFALDDGPGQIYTGSLSKILAPGVRLGYLLARPPLLDRLIARRDDAGSNTLAAAVAAEFFADGIGAHVARVNAVLRGKRDVLLGALQRELTQSCVWSRPPGGLFVWVRIPENVDRPRLRALCAADGVNYLPGSSFHHAGADVPYLRLAFGHLDPAIIDQGVERLARCLSRCRTSNLPRDFDELF